MDIKAIVDATAKMLTSYFTYQAVRVVTAQLRETDPPRALLFADFSGRQNLQDGEAYLVALLGHDPNLAFRVMTVRAHIAAGVAESLPARAAEAVEQSNQKLRGQYMERMLQLPAPEPRPEPPSE